MVSLYSLNINEILKHEKSFELFSLLPQYRQEKIKKFKRTEDRCLSFCAGILLKYILIEHCLDDNDIKVDSFGKPYINGLCFNISHSGDYVICAISEDTVGCDIEKIRKFSENIPKRFFSGNELEFLEDVSKENYQLKQQIFFRIWTAKEAYLKMTGEGIRGGLDSFSVIFHTKKGNIYDSIQIYRDEKVQDCYVKEYNICGYCCCVCSNESVFKENIIELKINDVYDKIKNNI